MGNSRLERGKPQAPVKVAMLAQPGHNGRMSLNTIAQLSLFVGHFAFFNLLNNCNFKRQRVVTLCAFKLAIIMLSGFKSKTCQRYSGRVTDIKKAPSGAYQ